MKAPLSRLMDFKCFIVMMTMINNDVNTLSTLSLTVLPSCRAGTLSVHPPAAMRGQIWSLCALLCLSVWGGSQCRSSREARRTKEPSLQRSKRAPLNPDAKKCSYTFLVPEQRITGWKRQTKPENISLESRETLKVPIRLQAPSAPAPRARNRTRTE